MSNYNLHTPLQPQRGVDYHPKVLVLARYATLSSRVEHELATRASPGIGILRMCTVSWPVFRMSAFSDRQSV